MLLLQGCPELYRQRGREGINGAGWLSVKLCSLCDPRQFYDLSMYHFRYDKVVVTSFALLVGRENQSA